LFTAYVQTDALRLHACTQSYCPLINGLVEDALWNASVTLRCRARVIRHFTSEQNKVSKSKVVEKVMPVPDNICQKL